MPTVPHREAHLLWPSSEGNEMRTSPDTATQRAVSSAAPSHFPIETYDRLSDALARKKPWDGSTPNLRRRGAPQNHSLQCARAADVEPRLSGWRNAAQKLRASGRLRRRRNAHTRAPCANVRTSRTRDPLSACDGSSNGRQPRSAVLITSSLCLDPVPHCPGPVIHPAFLSRPRAMCHIRFRFGCRAAAPVRGTLGGSRHDLPGTARRSRGAGDMAEASRYRRFR